MHLPEILLSRRESIHKLTLTVASSFNKPYQKNCGVIAKRRQCDHSASGKESSLENWGEPMQNFYGTATEVSKMLLRLEKTLSADDVEQEL